MPSTVLRIPFTFKAILQNAPQASGIIVLYDPRGKILHVAHTTTARIKGALLDLLANSQNTRYQQATHFSIAVKD